jgi:hypothetical protein
MPQVGFEPTIPMFERAKIVHALNRAVTVIGGKGSRCRKFGTDILVSKINSSLRIT